MSPLDRELEKALSRHAGDVTPPPDLYTGVERKATAIRRQRAGTVAGAALTVLALAVAVPALNRGAEPVPFTPPGPTDSPDPVVTTAPPDPTPTPSATSTTPVATHRVPVYFAAENSGLGFRLYREFHRLPEKTIAAAVTQMLRGTPLSARYTSLWPDDTKLNGVDVSGDLATVDLDESVRRASVGSQAAELAIQQLVYTVTATDNTVKRVRLLIDGKPVDELWGHVDTSKPFTRAPELDVLAPIWLLEPEHYAEVGRTFEIGGIGAVYEATLYWEVRIPQTGQVVVEGYAMTAGGQTRSPWSTTVTIPATVPAGTMLEVVTLNSWGEGENEQWYVADAKVVLLR